MEEEKFMKNKKSSRRLVFGWVKDDMMSMLIEWIWLLSILDVECIRYKES